MSYLVSTPHGDYLVHRSLELAERLARALNGEVTPLVEAPPGAGSAGAW